MPATGHPNRTPTFRLLTIASSGLGSFILGLWGLQMGLGHDMALMPAQMIGSVIAALCALTAATAAMSFFAGVDESADYVFKETHFDKLTGLLTRAAMVGQVADAASTTIKSGKPVFLVDIDIDRFKPINDSIGYSAGDELIRLFVERLKGLVPKDVPIGRLGAGEFAVLFEDDRIPGSLDNLLDTLIDALKRPYALTSHLQTINVSIGVVAMPKDGLDPTLILRRSNLALQYARSGGAGNWSVFHPDMGLVADYRQWIESELKTAFDRGDFELHYQPQLDLLNGSVVGYEALIRWKHPERGMIAPMEFIPIAEETGMIGPIGQWVLDKACSDARHLPDECFVAVNISPVQFMNRDFVPFVRATMERTGIAPSRLELEVTETAMVQDRDRAAAIFKELSEMGISVAVDDFGTGYSNLSYLIDFSFRKLKIDRSFVSRMESDASSGAIVSTIVGLSRALGVGIIAEGVETERQATLLKAAGCDVVQGFLFGEPAPLPVEVSQAHAIHPARLPRVASLH